MDFELCSKCGYVPTLYSLELLEKELKEKTAIKSTKSKTILNLSSTLREFKAKGKNHDYSVKYDDTIN